MFSFSFCINICPTKSEESRNFKHNQHPPGLSDFFLFRRHSLTDLETSVREWIVCLRRQVCHEILTVLKAPVRKSRTKQLRLRCSRRTRLALINSQGNSCQGLQKYQASSRCLTKWNTNGSFGLEAFRPIQMSESVVLKGDVFKVQISCCETIRPRANSQVFIWMQLSCGLLKILAISLYHTLFRPIPKSM